MCNERHEVWRTCWLIAFLVLGPLVCVADAEQGSTSGQQSLSSSQQSPASSDASQQSSLLEQMLPAAGDSEDILASSKH